jgi:hypothetical protein
MVLVDPFIPVRRKDIRLKRPVAPPRPVVPAEEQAFSRPPEKSIAAPKRRTGRVKSVLQAACIIVLATVLGVAANVQQIGEIALAVYAIVAFAARFSSRISFTLALLAFGMIIFLEIIRPGSELAANFAVYAFLLLVIGTVSLALEVRQEAKWERHILRLSKKTHKNHR